MPVVCRHEAGRRSTTRRWRRVIYTRAAPRPCPAPRPPAAGWGCALASRFTLHAPRFTLQADLNPPALLGSSRLLRKASSTGTSLPTPSRHPWSRAWHRLDSVSFPSGLSFPILFRFGVVGGPLRRSSVQSTTTECSGMSPTFDVSKVASKAAIFPSPCPLPRRHARCAMADTCTIFCTAHAAIVIRRARLHQSSLAEMQKSGECSSGTVSALGSAH